MVSSLSARLGFALVLPALLVATGSVSAQTTQASPGAAQPALAAPTKASPPVVESIVDKPQATLEVHKRPLHPMVRHSIAYHHHRRDHVPVDRPALAGVMLVEPLPPPDEPPHLRVPLPAYPLDSIATAWTTPAPPIVCHNVRRDRDLPDPHLDRETTVECAADNP